LETGQPEGCPARTTIIDGPETTTPEKWVWLSNDVKTHGASGVALVTRVLTPGCRFCGSAKLYQETHNGCKPEKGAFGMALIHASYFRLRCAIRSSIHAVISDCSQATFLPPRKPAPESLRAD
jgi:hypothetical protein